MRIKNIFKDINFIDDSENELSILGKIYFNELEKISIDSLLCHDNLKFLKLIIRLPHLKGRPAIERYISNPNLRNNHIEINDDSQIKIRNKNVNVSFAGCHFTEKSDNLLNAGVRYADKIYAVFNNEEMNNFVNDNMNLINIFQKIHKYFSLTNSNENNFIEYELRCFDLLKISKNFLMTNKPDKENLYAIIGLCYLLKAYPAIWIDCKNDISANDFNNSLSNSWNLILGACNNFLINTDLDNKFKWHIIFHLLGAIEWLGYLYSDTVFFPRKREAGKHLIELFEIIFRSDSVSKTIMLESIWVLSWIGLVTNDKYISTFLKKILKKFRDERYECQFPVLLNNIIEAINRTDNEDYRKAFSLIIALNNDGSINNSNNHKLLQPILKKMQSLCKSEKEIKKFIKIIFQKNSGKYLHLIKGE